MTTNQPHDSKTLPTSSSPIYTKKAQQGDNADLSQIFMSNISASFLWKFMIFLDWSDGFMGFGNAGALLDTIIRTEKNRNLNIISSLSADPNEREPNCLFRHSS